MKKTRPAVPTAQQAVLAASVWGTALAREEQNMTAPHLVQNRIKSLPAANFPGQATKGAAFHGRKNVTNRADTARDAREWAKWPLPKGGANLPAASRTPVARKRKPTVSAPVAICHTGMATKVPRLPTLPGIPRCHAYQASTANTTQNILTGNIMKRPHRALPMKRHTNMAAPPQGVFTKGERLPGGINIKPDRNAHAAAAERSWLLEIIAPLSTGTPATAGRQHAARRTTAKYAARENRLARPGIFLSTKLRQFAGEPENRRSPHVLNRFLGSQERAFKNLVQSGVRKHEGMQ